MTINLWHPLADPVCYAADLLAHADYRQSTALEALMEAYEAYNLPVAYVARVACCIGEASSS